MFPIIFGGINRREPWNPSRLPGTPREWLAGPDWCFTDGSAAFAGASNQSLSLGSASTLALSSGTVSLWFRVASGANPTSFHVVALKQNAYGLYVGSNTQMYVYDYTTGTVKGGVTFTADQWNHAVFRWNSGVTNGSDIWLNGVRGTPFTYTVSAQDFPFRVGSAGTQQSLTGNIASAGVWSAPVSDSVAVSLYASGQGKVYADTTASERTGLVSWWDLVRSGNFTDSHGSNNLTNNNGVSFGAGLPRARAGDTDPVSAWVDRWQGTLWSESDPLKRLVLRDLGGGRWVLRSDGVNDGIGHGPATTGARTIAMSYTQTTIDNNSRVLNANGVNSLVSPRRIGFNIYASVTTVRNTPFANDSDPHVFSMQRSGSGPWRAWSDGTSLAVTDQTTDFGSLGVGGFTGAGANETFAGDIYSVVDTAADISDADRAALTTYLSRLYGGSL